MNSIPRNRFGWLTWHQAEYEQYTSFYPHSRIMDKVESFVQHWNICNISSMHIRLTDLNALMPARKRISLSSFFAFVEGTDHPIFLMTGS